MNDDSIIADELVLLTSKIRKEVCGVLDFLFLFLINMKTKKPIIWFFRH